MVNMSDTVESLKIKKTLIKSGLGEKPLFEFGSKATFHFKTIVPDTQVKYINKMYITFSFEKLQYIFNLHNMCPKIFLL